MWMFAVISALIASGEFSHNRYLACYFVLPTFLDDNNTLLYKLILSIMLVIAKKIISFLAGVFSFMENYVLPTSYMR